MSDLRVSPTFLAALPFSASLGFVPVFALSAWMGGWWMLMVPIYGYYVWTIIDLFTGLNEDNPRVDETDDYLYWYRLIPIVWAPVQAALVVFALWVVGQSGWLSTSESVALFVCLGIITGAIGINYAHELMHQKNRLERWLGDFLMTMVLYGHFRSEHLLVHHRYVCTPRDPVTAPYNVGMHRVLPRVLLESLRSSWKAEAAMLARKNLGRYHRSNPFWRYALWQVLWLALAFAIAGGWGVLLFLVQAFVAVLHLELVNYVEHYGLTRRHLGDGKYEHVQPHHSWNAPHRATNWILINLQRHSDHHYKPDRRFPVLQTYPEDEAPQLPFGYPIMITLATIPPLWRWYMNPKVRAWRKQFYPDIEDWHPYNKRLTQMPR